MALINIDYLRKQLLSLTKTEEGRSEITLALAGLSGELELLTSTEVGALLGVSTNAAGWRAHKLRKHGYQVGIKVRTNWLYQPAEIELIRDYKKLVGTPTKESKNEMATN